MSLRTEFSIMMFLEFFIWGAGFSLFPFRWQWASATGNRFS